MIIIIIILIVIEAWTSTYFLLPGVKWRMNKTKVTLQGYHWTKHKPVEGEGDADDDAEDP